MMNGQPIILNTELAAPYQVMEGETLSGKSIKTVNCVLSKLDYEFEMQVVTWKRAMMNVKSNRSNGLFASMNTPDLDDIADISAPIILEKWYFFTLKKGERVDVGDKMRSRVGTIFGSNQYTWLEENGYTNIQGVETFAQLFKLMEIERIDAVLADSKTFYNEMKEAEYPDEYVYNFCKYTPLGVYFSKVFLNKNPEFLMKFNETIAVCSPEVSELTNEEKEKLKQLIRDVISVWKENQVIKSGTKAGNLKHKNISLSNVSELESIWRSEIQNGERPLIDSILNNDLSEYLREIQEKSEGLFTEIFVMDNKGLVVGMCTVTSDYWQGDEEKFTRARAKDLFIDDIDYDSSVQKFQSQINIALKDDNSNETIGVITVGVDLEKALRAVE